MDSRQWVGWPLSQAEHWPQFDRVEITTWSPTVRPLTAEPTSDTMPTPSWPSTTGVGNGMVPSITDTSLWHTPGSLDVDPHLVGPQVADGQVADDAQAVLVEHDPLHGTPPDRPRACDRPSSLRTIEGGQPGQTMDCSSL